jgi:hypothetical protein
VVTTESPAEQRPSRTAADRPFLQRPLLPIALASLALALPLLWLAAEAHYRGCVEAAQARYPAVPVSAFTTRTTGPLKLSFVAEREAAVEGCGRLPF